MEQVTALISISPLFSALFCAISRSSRFSYYCALLTLMLMSFCSVFFVGENISYNFGNWQPPYGIEHRYDQLNILAIAAINLVLLFTLAFGKVLIEETFLEYQSASTKHLFYSLILLAHFGFVSIFSTNDLFNLYVFIEISSLAIYILMSGGKNPRALIGSFDYLMLGTIGATLILISIGFILSLTGSLNITDIATILEDSQNPIIYLSAALFIAGVMLKIALFPMHFWMIRAYSNCPSILLCYGGSISTLVGTYLLMRFSYFVLPNVNILPILQNLFNYFAIITIVTCSYLALYFARNVKHTIIYSSAASVGYIFLLISNFADQTLLFKVLYFEVISKISWFFILAIFEANNLSLEYAGLQKFNLSRNFKILLSLHIIFSASMPPSVMFFIKINIFEFFIAKELYFQLITIIISSAFALLYHIKIGMKLLLPSLDQSRAHILPKIGVYAITCIQAASILSVIGAATLPSIFTLYTNAASNLSSLDSAYVIMLTIIIALVNLLTPFITSIDSKLRTSLMIIVAVFFLVNVLMLDALYLEGVIASFVVITINGYKLKFCLEAVGLIFLTMLATLWIPAIMYTSQFIRLAKISSCRRFLFFLNLCVICGILVALSANLITMFIFYEILTLSTIPLIISSSKHMVSDKTRAGLYKYLTILMLCALCLFLPAILITNNYAGHMNFIAGGILQGKISDFHAKILLLMFIFGAAKAALYPMHNWLPSAMVASYPVSALLHAVVVVKTGLFCIYKIMIYIYGLDYLAALFADSNFLILFPIATILYSSFQALRYNQIKTVLAYSTINQLSIALVSAFMLTPKAMAAAIMHMIAHSFTKIGLFYAAGNIYSVRNSYRLEELIGINSSLPKTSFVMLISGLSLIGIPPFAGFISKFYIMLAAAASENFLVMMTIGISALFSAIYMIKILIFIYRPVVNSYQEKLKLKPEFLNLEKNQQCQAENKLPILMLLAIFYCLIPTVGFIFILQFINKFLEFI